MDGDLKPNRYQTKNSDNDHEEIYLGLMTVSNVDQVDTRMVSADRRIVHEQIFEKHRAESVLRSMADLFPDREVKRYRPIREDIGLGKNKDSKLGKNGKLGIDTKSNRKNLGIQEALREVDMMKTQTFRKSEVTASNSVTANNPVTSNIDKSINIDSTNIDPDNRISFTNQVDQADHFNQMGPNHKSLEFRGNPLPFIPLQTSISPPSKSTRYYPKNLE